ncbi:unnamed protein product [Rotaria magnacalcarata]|uniref:Uncharacterized protein n=1 Tax=Rotaria magnacalcarata TaxID=392030 RepID=A0A816ZLR5_9BILA|nr:unnamed protein product [Rotaria magnacalcarata]
MTNLASVDSIAYDNDDHLEIFSIIWLDTNVHQNKNQHTKQKLRSIINHVKIFQDREECKQYIEQRSKDDRIVLIVNSHLGQQLVSSIHKLPQVLAIYVSSTNKKNDEPWTHQFFKVRAIVTGSEELVSRIEADHKNQMNMREPQLIKMFTTSDDAGKSTTRINGQFVFFQSLIDCLIRLKPNDGDRNELLSCLKNEYKDNYPELTKLHEFEKDYTSGKVLWWYTRDSFFYRTLNAALRKQNIHMIFLYRSFLFDLRSQLEKNHCKELVRVYRSQLMSIDEVNSLKQNIGHVVSTISFLSTSKKKKIVNCYTGDRAQKIDLERVLFKIDADPKVVSMKLFADISSGSQFPNAYEVLFMPGSIFRLNDDEHDLKGVLDDMKKQNGIGETSLWTLGKLSWAMGKLKLAEHYYNRLLQETSPDDPSLRSLYADLSKLASQQSDFEKSIRWHEKLLEIKEQAPESNSNKKGETVRTICMLYQR